MMKSANADFIREDLRRRKGIGQRNGGFMQIVQAGKLEIVSQGRSLLR
jgi:hypothetical protein